MEDNEEFDTIEKINEWRKQNGYEPLKDFPKNIRALPSNHPWRKPDQGGDSFWNFHNGH